jgi:hypothetical protein
MITLQPNHRRFHYPVRGCAVAQGGVGQRIGRGNADSKPAGGTDVDHRAQPVSRGKRHLLSGQVIQGVLPE